jgi:hypothetical protein
MQSKGLNAHGFRLWFLLVCRTLDHSILVPSVGRMGRLFQPGSSETRRRCVSRQPIGTRSNRCPDNRGAVDFLLLRRAGPRGPSRLVAGSQDVPGTAVARNV